MKTLILVLISFSLGVIATNLYKPKPTELPSETLGANTMKHKTEGTSMQDMVSDLHGKNGDDFDKTFIEGMIEHHQGAIDMAKLAEEFAKHQEIKDLSIAIIQAQTTEIEQMNEWQKSWGYKND